MQDLGRSEPTAILLGLVLAVSLAASLNSWRKPGATSRDKRARMGKAVALPDVQPAANSRGGEPGFGPIAAVQPKDGRNFFKKYERECDKRSLAGCTPAAVKGPGAIWGLFLFASGKETHWARRKLACLIIAWRCWSHRGPSNPRRHGTQRARPIPRCAMPPTGNPALAASASPAFLENRL